MTSRILFRSILGLLTGLFGACSSFDTQWKNAAHGDGATRWDGRWTSEKHHKSDGSAMGGRLRCVLEPKEAGKMAANFHANWLIFSGNYTVVLEPVKTGGHHTGMQAYRGTHELPAAFGGVYHYDATVDASHFAARYTSSYDHGTFALQRVLP